MTMDELLAKNPKLSFCPDCGSPLRFESLPDESTMVICDECGSQWRTTITIPGALEKAGAEFERRKLRKDGTL